MKRRLTFVMVSALSAALFGAAQTNESQPQAPAPIAETTEMDQQEDIKNSDQLEIEEVQELIAESQRKEKNHSAAEYGEPAEKQTFWHRHRKYLYIAATTPFVLLASYYLFHYARGIWDPDQVNYEQQRKAILSKANITRKLNQDALVRTALTDTRTGEAELRKYGNYSSKDTEYFTNRFNKLQTEVDDGKDIAESLEARIASLENSHFQALNNSK